MLLIDGVEKKATDLWGEGSFLPKPKTIPAVFKLPKSSIKVIKFRNGSTRVSKPNSFRVQAEYNIVDPKTGEMIQVRYFTNIRQDKKGNNYYVPEYAAEIGPKGDIVLDKQDMDLIFFMMHDPRNSKSPFRNEKKKALYYTENKAEDARVAAEKERMRFRSKEMLYGSPDAALGDDELLDVARAYEIPNAHLLTPDAIRGILKPYAEKDPETFIQNTSGYNMKVRALITEAVDLKLIKIDGKAWYSLTDTGKKDERLCEIRFKEQAVERLANHLLKNDGDLLTHLENLVEEKKVEEEIKEEEQAEA